MSRFLTIERRLALVIALVSLLVIWLAFQVPEPSTFLVVGPRVFPYALGGAMLLSAVLLFVLPAPKNVVDTKEEAIAEHTDAAGVQGVADADEGEDASLEWKRVLALMVLTLVYVLAFEPLGFVLATAPFIIAAALILGSRQWLRDTIVAVGVAAGIFYLFTQVLKVRLPGFPFDLF